MASIEERLEEFKKMSFDDQKGRVLLMLEWLKDSNEIFVKLLDVVTNNSNVDSEFLVWTYNDIIVFADAIKQSDKQKWANALLSLQDKIKRLHEIEAAERLTENPDGNLDAALSQI